MLLPPAYSTYELTKQHVSSFQNNKKENYPKKRIKYVHDVLFDFAAGVIATCHQKISFHFLGNEYIHEFRFVIAFFCVIILFWVVNSRKFIIIL